MAMAVVGVVALWGSAEWLVARRIRRGKRANWSSRVHWWEDH